MSPEEQLAWPTRAGASTPAAKLRGGAPASKNRSPAEPPTAGTAAPAPIEAVALHARVVVSEREFEALGPAWSALLAECADANVFLSHEWMHAWWSAYRPDARLAIVVIADGARLHGVAPLMIESARRAGVRVRVLRFIGDGTGETDHVGFLTARSNRARVLGELLDAIDELPWDLAEFNQLPAGAQNTDDLLRWLERRAYRPLVERVACPVRRLPSSSEGILAALPARLRTSIRSARRKLEQRHRVEFGLHADQRELGPALETFFANHESRWRGKGRSGAFSNAGRRGFYSRLTPRLLERGWLRFFYLKLDGRVVAQQYCFAVDGTVMLLQEGFDFEHAQDNVGNVLRAMVFEHLAASGTETYDFLAGSSRHKESWSDSSVDDLRIRCARRSWRGWVFHDGRRAVERAKEILRPWRDRMLARFRPAAAANGKSDGG